MRQDEYKYCQILAVFYNPTKYYCDVLPSVLCPQEDNLPQLQDPCQQFLWQLATSDYTNAFIELIAKSTIPHESIYSDNKSTLTQR